MHKNQRVLDALDVIDKAAGFPYGHPVFAALTAVEQHDVLWLYLAVAAHQAPVVLGEVSLLPTLFGRGLWHLDYAARLCRLLTEMELF